MNNKLKKFAIAMLLAGATVTASKAETLYESLSVNLVLSYYQATGTTNDKGDIIYPAANRKITTAEFLQLMAANLHVTLSKSAQLMRVTTLVPGTNITGFITNSPTLLPGNTALTNIEVPSTIVWQCSTNHALFVTNNYSTPSAAPPTNAFYTIPYSVANFVTYIIQGKLYKVLVSSDVEYYIINGTPITDTNLWIPLNVTNTGGSAGVSISTLDEAENFQNENVDAALNFSGIFYYAIDDRNAITPTTNYPTPGTNVYFGDYYRKYDNVNMNMADLVTNLNKNTYGSGYGPIFVGIIKTNMSMTGTLNPDTISISLGYPDEPAGTTNFLANLTLNGTNGTAVATIATGTNKLPFTSWNVAFDVSGSGYLDGVDTNNIYNTNYVYSSPLDGLVPEYPGFTAPGYGGTTNTNPPVSFTNSYVYETSASAPTPFITNTYTGPNPPATFTNTGVEVEVTTPDFTGYSYYYTNFIYTNVNTNVYTLVPTDTYDFTNFNVPNPITTTFFMTGTIKQATVKISTP